MGGLAVFTGGLFKQNASFNSIQVEGNAFFNPATFEGGADFISARMGGLAVFMDAVFKQKASFGSIQVEGRAFFNSATFEGGADFTSAHIGAAEFTGAVFKQNTSFNSIQIEGVAFYNPTTFEGKVDFTMASIGANVDFTSAQFFGDVDFYASEFKGDTHFTSAVFAKDVNFQNTSLRTVFFGESAAGFHGNIDLRGCTYDRIDPISIWRTVVKQLEPFDRQPFTQLEAMFRSAGEDRRANDVYYEYRDRKRRKETWSTIWEPPLSWAKVWSHLISWIGDRTLGTLTGYGVRLRRLVLVIIFLLAVGTYIFHFEGAVKPKQESQAVHAKDPGPNLSANSSVRRGLTRRESFWFSLSIFLPVEIPAGTDWKASSQLFWIKTPWGSGSMKFITAATLLKLAGWILVPIGVAGLTGILKR